MRITSLGTNFTYTNGQKNELKNTNEIKNQVSLRQSTEIQLRTTRDFKIQAKELAVEEELDLEKLNKIKEELESIDLTSEMLADVLITSFKNNRG